MASNEIAEALVRHLSQDRALRADLPPGPGTRLLDGTVDSLSLIELLAFVETSYGVTVPHEDVVPAKIGTVAELAHYVARRQPRPAPAARGEQAAAD